MAKVYLQAWKLGGAETYFAVHASSKALNHHTNHVVLKKFNKIGFSYSMEVSEKTKDAMINHDPKTALGERFSWLSETLFDRLLAEDK